MNEHILYIRDGAEMTAIEYRDRFSLYYGLIHQVTFGRACAISEASVDYVMSKLAYDIHKDLENRGDRITHVTAGALAALAGRKYAISGDIDGERAIVEVICVTSQNDEDVDALTDFAAKVQAGIAPVDDVKLWEDAVGHNPDWA
jgi:hypothetical protein